MEFPTNLFSVIIIVCFVYSYLHLVEGCGFLFISVLSPHFAVYVNLQFMYSVNAVYAVNIF